MKQSRLSLNDVEWGEFKIKDLFDVSLSKGDNKADLLNEGNIPLISSGSTLNGITKFINKGDGISELINNDTITVDMFGQSFFQPFNYFTVSHGRINILTPLIDLSRDSMRFITSCINESTKDIFSYNRMCSSTRLNKLKILLPIGLDKNPNWKFMEDYIKQEQKDIAQKVISYYEQKIIETGFDLIGLGDVEWRNFKIGDLFNFEKKPSKGLNNLEIANDNGISYLGATNRNNGVLEFVEPRKTLIYNGNCIAFIRNGEGSMGYSVYKKEDFIATQDISVGYNINLEQYNGMFITTIADRVRGKYNFGYKRNQIRLENEILTLPVDQNGEPHWEYMSKFMQKIEAEKLEKALEYIYIYIYIS